MTDATDSSATEPAPTTRDLMVCALIVAALASLAGSLVLWSAMYVFTTASGGPATGHASEDLVGLLFVAAISTIVAFPAVLAALLLLAVPLTRLLARRGAAPTTRNLILLGIAAVAAVLLAVPFLSQADAGSSWIFPPYALAAGLLWVLALRRLDRAASIARSDVSAAFD